MTASVAQTKAATAAAAAGSIAVTALTTTAGNGLILAVGVRDVDTITGVSDGHNTWALYLRITNSVEGQLEIWTTTNASPTALSSGSITATCSGSTLLVARMWEINGGVNTALFDQSNSGVSTSSAATWATSATATLAAAGELALGVVVAAGPINSLTSVSGGAFTQGSESTGWPTTTTIDASNGSSEGCYLHSGELSITTTTGQAYSGTFGTSIRYSAFVGVLANPNTTPPPVPITIIRPRSQTVRSHGETTGGAPILGENTYRAQLVSVTPKVEEYVPSRARITRTVAPLNNPPLSTMKAKQPKPSVIKQVASKAVVKVGTIVVAAVPKPIVRPTIVRPSVIAVRKATATITRGLKVQAGQSTFAAKPTRTRPMVQFVRSLTKTLLQPFGPISPPYVPPAGADGWGDDWDKWNIANPADPNYGDGWE